MTHFLPKTVLFIIINSLLPSPTDAANVYVSSAAKKETSCGSIKDPCRTIQAAINVAKPNSQITIIATSSPYDDCPIIVNRPLAFAGIRGTPVIDCAGKQDAFRIDFTNLENWKELTFTFVVMMKNLKIRNAKTAIFYGKEAKRTTVMITDSTFEDNDVDVKYMGKKNVNFPCILQMKGVTVRGSSGHGLRFESCGQVEISLTESTFLGKYLEVVSTRSKLTVKMKGVTWDMSTRSNASEVRSPVHIETVKRTTNTTATSISVWSSRFLNHAGTRHGSFAIETRPQTIPGKEKRSGKKKKAHVYHVITFYNVTFANNSVSAANGSAFSYGYRGDKPAPAQVLFVNCTFRDNSAQYRGGALWLEKIRVVKLTGCGFFENRANGVGTGQGGAVFVAGSKLSVNKCHFRGNSATKHGGTLQVLGGATTSIEDTVFTNDRDSRPSGMLGDVMYVRGNDLRLNKNVTFDLVSANNGKAIMWFKAGKAILIMKNSTRFVCPRGYHYEKLDTFDIREGTYHFFGFTCAPCHDQFYSVTRGYHVVANNTDVPGKCKQCPNGALCDGTIRARENFWGAVRGDEVEMVPCPRGYCCDREPCASYDTCASHRTGTLCGRCESGFSEGISSPTCHPNESCRGGYLVILLLCTFFIFIVLLFQLEIIKRVTKFLQCKVRPRATEYRPRSSQTEVNDEGDVSEHIILPSSEAPPSDIDRVAECEEFNHAGGYLKVFVYFYQVVALLRVSSYGARSSSSNDVIEFFVPFFNFQFSELFTADCLFVDLTPVTRTLFRNSVCCFLFSFAFLSYVVYSLIRCCRFPPNSAPNDNDNPRSFPVRLTGAVMQITLLSYVAMTQLTLGLVHCVKVGDHHVLQIDGSVVCYHTWYQPIVFAFFWVNIAFLPFVLIFGRKLLSSDQLSPRRFIVACFFSSVFLAYWAYQYRFRGEYRRPNAEPVANHYKDTIIYILQHPYRPAVSRESPTLSERMAANWESVLMLRRLVLVIAFIFANSYLLRTYLLFILLFLYLLHHSLVQPFVNAKANALETVFLSVLMLFAGFSIAEASFSEAGVDPPHLVITVKGLEDVFVAFFPFTILAVIAVVPKFKYYCGCSTKLSSSGSSSSLRELLPAERHEPLVN